MQLWESQRKNKGETPGSPGFSGIGMNPTLAEANLPPDFRRKYEVWQRRKLQHNDNNPSGKGDTKCMVFWHEGHY